MMATPFKIMKSVNAKSTKTSKPALSRLFIGINKHAYPCFDQ